MSDINKGDNAITIASNSSEKSDNSINNNNDNDNTNESNTIANRIPSNEDNSKTEISRDEILKQLFGDVGELISDFSCAVESTVLLHGRMYVTNRVLCFYSNLFGLEKKIRIPYSHITVFTKENTALVFPNAIAITTYRKEYLFRSFWDRDECFKLLKDLIAKIKTPDGTVPPKIAGARRSSIQGSNNLVAFNGSPDLNVKKVLDTRTDSGSLRRNSSADDDDYEDSEYNADDEETTNNAITPVTSNTINVTTNNSADDSIAYQDEVTKSRLKITAASGKLQITLKDFSKLFIEENAPYGFKQYHEKVNDTNLDMSAWAETSSSMGLVREMKFLKPVNLPALKSTRGVKLQRYRSFGNHGLVVCSSTRLEDVPAADTFSVEDMLAVHRIDDENVFVEITFEVKFIKSTLFKYVIESSTNAEMGKWLEVYFNELNNSIKKAKNDGILKSDKGSASKLRTRTTSDFTIKDKSPDEKSLKVATIITKNTKKKSNLSISLPIPIIETNFLIIGCWIISIIILLFFCWQWYSVKHELKVMSNQIQDLNKNLMIISSNQDFISSSFQYQNSLIKALVSSSNIPKNILLELEVLGTGKHNNPYYYSYYYYYYYYHY